MPPPFAFRARPSAQESLKEKDPHARVLDSHQMTGAAYGMKVWQAPILPANRTSCTTPCWSMKANIWHWYCAVS